VSGCRVVLASASHDGGTSSTSSNRARGAAANIDETVRPRESPRRYAERLAREKASAIASRDPDLITIGADTVVVIDRKVLGKPADTADAAECCGC